MNQFKMLSIRNCRPYYQEVVKQLNKRIQREINCQLERELINYQIKDVVIVTGVGYKYNIKYKYVLK